jgi:hypothetical protein
MREKILDTLFLRVPIEYKNNMIKELPVPNRTIDHTSTITYSPKNFF